MARINRTDLYVYDGVVSDNDYIIGSDGDTVGAKTKSYKMKDVRDFLLAGLSPTVGGTMQYTEYTYNGGLTSPAAVLNALNPVFVVLPYHIVVVSVNGDKYILKLQDVTVGFSQTPIADSNFIMLRGDVSLGDGLDVLKGYNTVTKKHEFYSLKSTSLNLSKETISSIETGNILVEMKTDINLNIGVGSENVYKGYNVVNSKHEFKGIKDSTSLDVSSDTTDISIEIKENLQNTGSIGSVPIYTSFDNSTKKHKLRALKSESLNVTGNTEDVFIEIPELGANTIYVNNKYTGSAPNGSKTKPYKNITDAVIGYIGTGTRLAPEKAGYVLYVERGSGSYDETNLNLTIKNLIFYLERDTTLYITNGSNWIADLDSGVGATFGSNYSLTFYIYGLIYLFGNGFRSSGTNSTTSFTNTSTIFIKGDGRINLLLTSAEASSDPILQRYSIINAGKVNPLNQNGDQFTFRINDISFYSTSQRIIDLGGQLIELDNVEIFSAYDNDTIDVSQRTILITGGLFKVNYGSIGGSGTVKRTALIHVDGGQTSVAHQNHQPSLSIQNVLISGKYSNFISYKHTAIPSYNFSNRIDIIGVYNSYVDADYLLYNQTTTINTFNIKNCILTGIPKLKNIASLADVLIATTASNVIGAYTIDTLPQYANHAAATSAGLLPGAKFNNTNGGSSDKNTWKIQVL